MDIKRLCPTLFAMESKIFQQSAFSQKIHKLPAPGKSQPGRKTICKVPYKYHHRRPWRYRCCPEKPKFDVGNEDFDQTLGKWGIGNGCYIVVPVLGPFTVRSAVGYAGDIYTTPPILF